jgi:hypothetical protein
VILRLALALSFALAACGANFAGKWSWAAAGGDFHLTVRQKGAGLSGEMEATALEGRRVSTGSFTGTAKGRTAVLKWAFRDGDRVGPPAGSATLRIDGRWTLDYPGAEDCWFPRKARLKRAAASRP